MRLPVRIVGPEFRMEEGGLHMQGPRAVQFMTALSMHGFSRYSTGRHGDTHLCDQHNSKSEQADDVPLRQRGSTYLIV